MTIFPQPVTDHGEPDPVPLPGRDANQHLSTDHLMGDLKGRSVRGGAITVVAQALKFVLHLGSTMVLARLLDPTDFGLLAMVLAITGFVEMFKDAGLTMATIQRKDITQDQVSTLFWINVALSAAMVIVVSALAPLIAAFYSEPRLLHITLALAGLMIFGGLTAQHQALLRRQMRFKASAIIQIISMATGIAVAITMALMGFGYWALVGNIAGMVFANAVLVWILCDWRPGPPKRGTGVGSMLRFGGGLMTFNLFNYFTRNADNVIIGFALGSASLGIYSKAYNLLMLPIRQINAPIASVMLPALSRLQDNPVRYRRAYLQAISALAMVGMPIVATAFVLADELVLVLLGSGWEAAANVFRWLAPAALLGTVNVAPGWLCVSLGRTGVQVRWAIISSPITVIGFLIGVQWGVVGVAAAFSITWCIGLYVFIAMACRNSPVSQRDLLTRLAPQLMASLLAAGFGLFISSLLPGGASSTLVRIAVVLPSMAVLYLATLWALPGSREQLTTLLRDGLRSAALPGRKAI